MPSSRRPEPQALETQRPSLTMSRHASRLTPMKAARPPKTTRAKLFRNGGSQAVRLPKDCRFAAQGEVLVHRQGRRVILEAADEWPDRLRACLGAWPDRIPRPKQQRLRDARDPFA